MSIVHEHRYRFLGEHRGGFDLFYCEICLEYRAVRRDDQAAVRELEAPSSAPTDVLTRVMFGRHPDEEEADRPS